MKVVIRSVMSVGALVALGVSAACVPPTRPAAEAGLPSSVVSPSPVPLASAPMQPSGAPVTGATAGPAAARNELLLGSLRDEDGAPVVGGTVTVRSASDPGLNQTLQALGGSYVLGGLREGTRLTLIATAPGYGERTREWVVAQSGDDDEDAVNRVDFGGDGKGMWHFLSKHFEIARVTPANQAKAVVVPPLAVRFDFSHALKEESLAVFANMLRVTVKGALGEETLRVGSNYREVRPRFEWAADRKSGTFSFDAPIVVGRTESTTVTVGFNPDVRLEDWPRSVSGAALGWQVLDDARDHTHSSVGRAIAPFVGINSTEAIPSERPSAVALWAGTHHTQVVFGLKPEQVGPRAIEARFDAGINGKADTLEVRYDQPICGFPESALDGEVLRASHYRFVVGKTEERRDRTAFEEADPTRGGNSPVSKGRYHWKDTDRVIFDLPVGFLKDYTHYKLFVGPGVTDLNGNALAVPEGQLLQGVI